MATPRLPAAKAFFVENWHSGLIVALALCWCSIFWIVRQPQTPFAFDLPQAQTNGVLPGESPTHASDWAVSNAWLSAYPTSLFNCGNAGWARCSNYCDQNSLVRYTECTSP